MVSTRTTDELRELTERGGWIGVDLDGTLFTYHRWVGWNQFGEPIRPMIRRVLGWLRDGVEVRIVTARVGLPFQHGTRDKKVLVHSGVRENFCRVTREAFSDLMMVEAIQAHCGRHGLPSTLRVQPHKDVEMIELWDDRAVQVIANSGLTLAEEQTARMIALGGKQWGGERQ